MLNKDKYNLTDLGLRKVFFDDPYKYNVVDKDGRVIDVIQIETTDGDLILELFKWLESDARVLTPRELEYLLGVVEPFRTMVEGVTKKEGVKLGQEYIAISIKGDSNICLPHFPRNMYYRGLELDKMYKLHEL